jgi:glycerophosphoryl diester phosphodiesterase
VLDRVCVGSFQHRTIAALRDELGSELCTAATAREVRLLLAASAAPRSSRRALTFAINADCVQVPVRDGRIRIVTDRFVDTCHDAGLPVHVWTIDDPDEMHELFDLGVDGVMPDRPHVLSKVLQDRGAWDADGPTSEASA